MSKICKFIVPTEEFVVQCLRQELDTRACASIRTNGVFRIGLSGGSMLNYLCEAIPLMESDLEKWRFFFCDERYVDENDEESTFGAYKKKLVGTTNIKVEQFVPISMDLPLDKCAEDYQKKILEEFGLDDCPSSVPQFDVLLLGMGPDGHTCSLFPGHPLLREKHKLIAYVEDSPKPPPKRITMTFPLINNARCCIFAICGEGKADIVKRVFLNHEKLPAAMVAPINGVFFGFFDEAAAKFLTC